jgi:hypothetical protein
MKIIILEMDGQDDEHFIINENLVTGVCENDDELIVIETTNTIVHLGMLTKNRLDFMKKLRSFLEPGSLQIAVLIKKNEKNFIQDITTKIYGGSFESDDNT